MERERLTEGVLREEITMLREQETRLRRSLGHIEKELRMREAEYMAVRGDQLLEQRVNDDWE
jgi:hypothetical protein